MSALERDLAIISAAVAAERERCVKHNVPEAPSNAAK